LTAFEIDAMFPLGQRLDRGDQEETSEDPVEGLYPHHRRRDLQRSQGGGVYLDPRRQKDNSGEILTLLSIMTTHFVVIFSNCSQS
jgi:hypothetical protein